MPEKTHSEGAIDCHAVTTADEGEVETGSSERSNSTGGR
jgi:hypothetical protein